MPRPIQRPGRPPRSKPFADSSATPGKRPAVYYQVTKGCESPGAAKIAVAYTGMARKIAEPIATTVSVELRRASRAVCNRRTNPLSSNNSMQFKVKVENERLLAVHN